MHGHTHDAEREHEARIARAERKRIMAQAMGVTLGFYAWLLGDVAARRWRRQNELDVSLLLYIALGLIGLFGATRLAIQYGVEADQLRLRPFEQAHAHAHDHAHAHVHRRHLLAVEDSSSGSEADDATPVNRAESVPAAAAAAA